MIYMRPSALAMTIAALVSVFLLMPLVAVIPVSFTPERFLSLPTGEWSLRHYHTLLENPAWINAALLSARIGLLSAVVATSLALLFSLGIWMSQPRFAAGYFNSMARTIDGRVYTWGIGQNGALGNGGGAAAGASSRACAEAAS